MGADSSSFWVSAKCASIVVSGELVSHQSTGYVSVADTVRSGVKSLLNQLNKPNYQIHFVGHSLGGSVASLAAMDVSLYMPEIAGRIRLYTYGQPR